MKNNELHPYKTSFFSKIPLKVRIPLIKWWFMGAIYYFVGWGLPQFRSSGIDTIFILGLIIGLVNITVLQYIIKELSVSPDVYNIYLSIRNKSVLRGLISVIYGWIIAALIATTYELLNRLFIIVFSLKENTVSIGVEPILFGILYVLFDGVWMLIRNFIFRKA